MTNRLAGKVAVITGASTGIGLAAAKRFIREGMDRVFITDPRENALDAAVAEIGEKATGIPGDVASLTDVDRLYEAVNAKRYLGLTLARLIMKPAEKRSCSGCKVCTTWSTSFITRPWAIIGILRDKFAASCKSPSAKRRPQIRTWTNFSAFW